MDKPNTQTATATTIPPTLFADAAPLNGVELGLTITFEALAVTFAGAGELLVVAAALGGTGTTLIVCTTTTKLLLA
jgi:hypothetical protein